MKKWFLIVIGFILLINIAAVNAKECQEILRPKIKIEPLEEAYENKLYYKELFSYKLPFFEFYPINSSMENFYFNSTSNEIIFTPNKYDIGKHKLLFVAIDSSNCYTAKLINFNVYDKPKIIPIRPDVRQITLSEGVNLVFLVDIEDKDDDIADIAWYIDEKRQKGSIENKFVFVSDYQSAGRYNVSLVVIDEKSLNDTYKWRIDVKGLNRNPYLFSDIPNYAASQGEEINTDSLDNYFGDSDRDYLRYQVDIKDEDGNNIYTYKKLTQNNELIIRAPENFTGVLVVEVLAIDPSGEITKSRFTITVFENQEKTGVQIKEFHICGDKICGGEETCSNCEEDCGPCFAGLTKCVNKWECNEWGECILPGYQLRGCDDLNSCYDTSKKPRTARECIKTKSCFDGIINQGETKVDCGGPCDPCPTCFDKKKNQGEEGIDCGGPCNKPCPSCDDFIQNQFESDADCGGPCQECDDLSLCFSFRDCKSHVCKEGICQLPTCFDQIKNQDENGVDCEGICGGVCPTCDDGIQNQDENGVDCGGSCDICPTCDDKIKNQKELMVDCSGPCKMCTWNDFKTNNRLISILLRILAVFLVLPFVSFLLIKLVKISFANAGAGMLLFFDKINKSGKNLKQNQDALIKLKETIEKLKTKEQEIEQKETRDEFVNAFSIFAEMLSLSLSNDKEHILKTLKQKDISYPANRIILYLLSLANEVRDQKYYSDIVLSERMDYIKKILNRLLKDINH